MTACHVLILHNDGTWQAWCKPCNWASLPYAAESWARAAAFQHRPARVPPRLPEEGPVDG
jgi:hypothetical protein